jgi:hypothetical protein
MTIDGHHDLDSRGGLLPRPTDVNNAGDGPFDVAAGAGPLPRYSDDPKGDEIWIKGRLTDVILPRSASWGWST